MENGTSFGEPFVDDLHSVTFIKQPLKYTLWHC